jgi:hypothetical protein
VGNCTKKEKGQADMLIASISMSKGTQDRFAYMVRFAGNLSALVWFLVGLRLPSANLALFIILPFHPWWDSTSNFLASLLVVLGKSMNLKCRKLTSGAIQVISARVGFGVSHSMGFQQLLVPILLQ